MTETKVEVRTEILPVVLRVYPALDMDEDRFFEFCQQNRDLRIERTQRGDLEIVPPTGGETGNRNFILGHLFAEWGLRDGTGTGFDSSSGFVLPNGATRSPDLAWVRRGRLAGLTAKQKRRFLPLCPDFVIEFRSPSDRLCVLQGKMEEYVENGARLDGASEVSGDPELPGFVLDLSKIWDPGL